MKDGFVGQKRFVGHQKKNHFRIIVVCMKYKSCVSRLLYEDTRSLRSRLLYGNCRGGVVVVVDMTVVETMVVETMVVVEE